MKVVTLYAVLNTDYNYINLLLKLVILSTNSREIYLWYYIVWNLSEIVADIQNFAVVEISLGDYRGIRKRFIYYGKSNLKGTIMQIWKFVYMFVFIKKEYLENFAFLFLRNLKLFAHEVCNFLKK